MDYKLIYLARRNPAIAAEDWPRAWRAHAVFASQFPVLGARIKSLFYCARVLRPEVDGLPYDPPGVSSDHDGVAVVASPSAEGLGGELTEEDRARILEDELRAFATHTENFSFRAREALVVGGPPGEAAVVRFLARKGGTSAEAFHARWAGRHAELATEAADALGTAVRYVQNELIETPPPGYPFDGISETWFGSADDAARSFADPAFERIDEDLSDFCDRWASVTLLTRVIHRWPKG